jgi:formyltetrahydrofolate synthetase
VTLSVRLGGAGSIGRAVFRPADGDARELELRSTGDVHAVTVPDVGVYAVLELKGAAG